MSSWLSDASANRHIKTYVKDFLDLSGNMYVRNGNLDISGGNATINGKVGIGTDNPAFKLDIENEDNTYLQTSQGTTATGIYGANWRYGKSNNNYQYWDAGMHTTSYFYFRWSGTGLAFVKNNSNVGQLTFTGQHRNFIENIPASKTSNYIGLIVSANKNEYFHIDKEAKRGNEAITINDAVPLVTICSIEKDKTVFGVISDAEEINTDGGRTHASGQFVSVVEKQTGDNRTFINSLGEGAIWVSNKNGNLESGDYITGSSVPGYGQKQESEFLANYTVGKITMDCDFNPQLQYKKRVIKQDIVFTGPDASSNYYDVSNNVLIYTEAPNIYKNTNYNLAFDASNNLISVTQNVLDANEEIQWEDTEEQERKYNIRYIDASANILIEDEYNTKKAAGEEVYIAAFVGCTYHCG